METSSDVFSACSALFPVVKYLCVHVSSHDGRELSLQPLLTGLTALQQLRALRMLAINVQPSTCVGMLSALSCLTSLTGVEIEFRPPEGCGVESTHECTRALVHCLPGMGQLKHLTYDINGGLGQCFFFVGFSPQIGLFFLKCVFLAHFF